MSAKPRNDDDKPAGPCLSPAELERVKEAVTQVDAEKTKLILRPAAIGVAVMFIIGCTWSVAVFMHEARAFQRDTTEALETNRKAITTVSNQVATIATQVGVLTVKQNNVIGDRWRFSDQQPWAYQLEKANRDVLREGGGKGLVVPEPIAKKDGQ